MTGYGMTNSGNSPAVIVKSAPKIIIRKSVLASALVKATTSAKSSAKVPNTVSFVCCGPFSTHNVCQSFRTTGV